MLLNEIKEITKPFLIRRIKSSKAIVTGNINSTLLLEADKNEKYILQKINSNVFKNPEEIMQNIRRVSRYLEKQVLEEGGNPKREVLHPITTLDGSCFVIDENGDYWRMYYCIEGATTYDKIDSVDKAFKAGQAFGKFQKRLQYFPANTLHEAISDFHNTPKRFTDFELAMSADKEKRLKNACGKEMLELKDAINYLIQQKDALKIIEVGKLNGILPLRVTHNDTKINNVMLDDETGEAICVIDLDTVGPDSILVDYGDAIRSACNVAGEEAKNINDVVLNMRLFEEYTRGYLSEACLNKYEIERLHIAPKILTLELALRFLTDYLNGDVYFKLKKGQPGDLNLKRALIQLQLAKSMESHEDEMKCFIKSLVASKNK